MTIFLDQLNEAQREAATTVDGAILILAGAGTGKTKTITTRLAYLLSLGIDPKSTLTLTFTNKAAKEMRERAMVMIGQNAIYPPALYTFHKFGLQFLRFHIGLLGRNSNFVIIDTDDRKKILKQICGEKIEPKVVAASISRNKNSLLSPQDALGQNDGFDPLTKKHYEKLAELYRVYQDYLDANNLVDFDDLLLLPYLIMRGNEELKLATSMRYKYLMVDEYQDTNELQLQLLKQLCCAHENLCVVGDDDQSIYGWRGANVQNILGFAKFFSNVKIVKLEMNYRSTQEIITAANELISHNQTRHEKRLIGTQGGGDAVDVKESFDEAEESRSIAHEAERLIARGVSPRNIAVLFRINALSRALEEAFVRAKVPYSLIDNVGFYERQEVKDALAYLRLIVNPHDDFSLRRVINKPKRGIGEVSVGRLASAAEAEKLSVFELIGRLDDTELAALVGKKSVESLRELETAIDSLAARAETNAAKLIDSFEELIGLRKFYEERGESERVENIDELYGLLRDHAEQNPDATLSEFLAESALSSDQDAISGESVNLMTIHAAKGLEFDYVFVVGLEEGFFPLVGDGNDIEEERRLGYVAFTRAKKRLVLCSAESRFFRGRRERMKRSRFFTEAALAEGHLLIKPQGGAFKKGDIIKHKLFGMGRVVAVTQAGREQKLSINFGGVQRDILSNFVERI